MKRKVDRLVLVLISVLLMVTGLLAAGRVSAAPPAEPNAEAQLTKAAQRGGGAGKKKPTPKPTPKPPTKAPKKVRTKAHFKPPPRPPSLCAIPIVSPNASLFVVVPENGRVEIQKPHVVHDLIVQPCPWRESSSYIYRLLAPDGTQLDESEPDQNIYYYDFHSDATEGEYHLYIIESSGSSSTN